MCGFRRSPKSQHWVEKKLRLGEDTETKKCTSLALGDGVESAAQGKPKRCPSRQRLDVLASGIRFCEIIGAEQAHGQTPGVDMMYSREIDSICRDVLTSGNERDYKAPGMYFLSAIWKFVACEVAAIEIQPTEAVVSHLPPAPADANNTMLFLVVRHGHRIWGGPHQRQLKRGGAIGSLRSPRVL